MFRIPHSADREGTVHNKLPLADRRMLHFLPDTLPTALTCLLALGLRNWAPGLGEDYERITLQCQTETPVLGVPSAKLEYNWPNYASIFHWLTATAMLEQLIIKLVKMEKNIEMTINVTIKDLDDLVLDFVHCIPHDIWKQAC